MTRQEAIEEIAGMVVVDGPFCAVQCEACPFPDRADEQDFGRCEEHVKQHISAILNSIEIDPFGGVDE